MTVLAGELGDAIELSAACEEAFCRAIARRTGIVLQDHQLPNLRETIRLGCERFNFPGCPHYLQNLESSQGLTAELEFLIAGVTVGESYFFRDSEQISLLREQLLPEMIAAKRVSGDLSLRIWSAGCSMGQEIYTLALMLRQLIPDIASWRIHLLGTDINTEVVAKAMQGRYSEWSFRATPPAVIERWFSKVDTEYVLDAEVRSMVRFAYLNLTEDAFPSVMSETHALDMVLCRNVFIYLDREVIRRVMAQFAECLTESGVLMLGASDPVDYGYATLVWQQTDQTAYFRKNSRAISDNRSQVAQAALLEAAVAVSPQQTYVPETPRPELPERQQAPVQPVIQPDRVKMAIAMLGRGDWEAGLAIIEQACELGEENSMLQQMKAQALANLGRAEQAQQACERSLQLDPDNKHAYLVQAMILGELNQVADAEEALRKALYLDRAFLEAHYELGMLRMRSGRLAPGIKSLENALQLALAGDPQRGLHNAGGMTYQRFAQVLASEIEIYRGGHSAKTSKLASLNKI
ncbi:CheR family methyltransferase [Sulfuriferula thiophila]|uniref:CheR family methyltransferase n=1 Tax=Sulfuriferula thiophila TaxID=1781211 RepID=UPI000F60751E|nr:CheR family methyltransferase [Sulfuriferula thiophila]